MKLINNNKQRKLEIPIKISAIIFTLLSIGIIIIRIFASDINTHVPIDMCTCLIGFLVIALILSTAIFLVADLSNSRRVCIVIVTLILFRVINDTCDTLLFMPYHLYKREFIMHAKQIQSALEQYHADYDEYPANNVANDKWFKTYMGSIPKYEDGKKIIKSYKRTSKDDYLIRFYDYKASKNLREDKYRVSKDTTLIH